MVWCSVRETQTEEAAQTKEISSDELNCNSIRLTTLFFSSQPRTESGLKRGTSAYKMFFFSFSTLSSAVNMLGKVFWHMMLV